MSVKLLGLLTVLVIALGGCGGGGFSVLVGLYNGNFKTNDVIIGTFAVTVNQNSVTGSGVITHNAQSVQVVVAAVYSGDTITGKIENSAVGSGAFTGYFIGSETASGTFTFTDDATGSSTSGTWNALRDQAL